MRAVEVSVVMPCLNEEATIGACIEKALTGIRRLGVPGEVVVADNGSTDRSVALAESLGARVVHVPVQGYGSAYQGGIAAAAGRVIVIGDSDDTYDFSRLDELVRPLERGAGMVIGSRLRGEIVPGAMPWLHRYVGNPLLSWVLNSFYGSRVSDTHSGMRAFTRDVYDRLALVSSGMEYASEMIIAAAEQGVRIDEVPIAYHPRQGESKLRSFRDGWRHLRLLLLYSPRHLFVRPGLVMLAAGILLLLALLPGPITIGRRMVDYHFMFVGSLLAILGTQVATLGLFARSHREPPRWFTLERGLVAGAVAFGLGLAANLYILGTWILSEFGPLNAVRLAILALTLTVVGTQVLFSSFYLDLISRPGGSERLARRQPAAKA
jgi:hypothetical protein